MEKEAVIGTMSDSRQYQSYGAIPSGVPPNTVNVHRNTIVIIQEKHLYEAYLLAIPPFGLLGLHHFYLRRPLWGLLYFFTLGVFGLGWLIDIIRMPCLVRRCNAQARQPQLSATRSLDDCYILWLPPFGLLGVHQFYMRRPIWGVVYIFTLGLCGIGWLLDGLCLMRIYCKRCNEQIRLEEEGRLLHGSQPQKSLATAYLLAIFPLTGIFGFHHAYLNNFQFFAIYMATIGNLGFGWLYDLFRIPVLVDRANEKIANPLAVQKRHTDDVYALWLPFTGLLGIHHLLLGQPLLTLVYIFTCGGFGIGWLSDLCLIPYYTKRYNKKLENIQRQVEAANVIVTPEGTRVYPIYNGPYNSGGVGGVLTIYPPGVHPPPGAHPSPGVHPPSAMLPQGTAPPCPPYAYQSQPIVYPAHMPAPSPQARGYPPQPETDPVTSQYDDEAPPPYIEK